MFTELYRSRSTICGGLGVIVTAVLLLLCTAQPSQGQLPCGEVCLLGVTAPNDTTACAGSTYTGTFVIENCNIDSASLRGQARPVGRRGSGVVATHHYELTATCNGQTLSVAPATLDLAPGEKSSVTITCALPAACNGPLDIELKAVASLIEAPDCIDSTTVDVRVDCVAACVEVNDPVALEACAGDSVEVPFTVRNCGTSTINVNMMAACNGQIVDTVAPSNFDLEPGQSRVSTVTCVVPADCRPGESLTVVNSAWVKTADGCAMDIAGSTRINCIECPVGGSCGPLALVAPPLGEGCPGEAITVSFTVENQGEAAVDVYVRTPTTGWLLTPTVFTNLASGVPAQVTASWTLPPSGTPAALVLSATSYPADSTPADTAGLACAVASDLVDIQIGDDCEAPLAEACPRTIGFWRQQTQQKSGGSRKICADDGADSTDMWRLWSDVIALSDLDYFRTNDGSTVSTAFLASLEDGDLFDALGCELAGPRPMTQRDMAEAQYLALLLNVAMGLVDLDTQVDNGSFEGTIGEAIDEIEEILNHDDAGNSKWSEAIGIADAINNGTGVRGRPCTGGENGPFANFGSSCPTGNTGFVCPEVGTLRSLNQAGSTTARLMSMSALPNPLNPTALLRWTARPDQLGQQAVITVFDAAGRPVARLFEGVVAAESNELPLAADGWSSGMYLARLTVGNESIVYRLLLVK